MAQIKVADAVQDQINLLARAWSTSEGEVVRRLLEEFRRAQPADNGGLPEDGVPVHVVYDGVQTDGVYLRASRRLRITSGMLNGRTFKTPSGAATEVVRNLNPEVQPNRNGWKFWTVSATGQPLESLRPGGEPS